MNIISVTNPGFAFSFIAQFSFPYKIVGEVRFSAEI
jgi:hypothetical protein